MPGFKLVFVLVCICVMSTAACAAGPAEASTRFFETHPNAIDLEERGDSILFANRHIGLEFRRSAGGFQVSRLYGIAEDQDFLTAAGDSGARDLFEVTMALDPIHVGKDEIHLTKTSLFGIIDEMARAADAFPIGSHAANKLSWRREDAGAESTLRLEWKGMDVREAKEGLDVDVMVTLRAGDPLSYWRIVIRNSGEKYGVERVRFPILSLAPIGKAQDNVFLIPQGRGELMDNPFRRRTINAYYPHNFNMQFQALYNGKSGNGILLGTRDSTPNLMHIRIVHTPSEISWRPGHFPPNITFARGEGDFLLSYDCVAGPFRGDWFDASQIYREWALKQSWSRKGPLSTREEVPTWYKEAPLHFYTTISDSATGTHSKEENIRIAADHFREFLTWARMPLPASFYAIEKYVPGLTVYDRPTNLRRLQTSGRWAGMNPHTSFAGNYPEIPTERNFAAEARRLRREGGMVSPYLPLEIFDQGASENAPYAAEAKPNITRDLYGALRTWGGLWAWQPCAWTPWWRNRLKETCILMLQREGIGGFYLDVLQGSALPCYWTAHGHSAAGADATTTGMHELVEILYNAVKAQDPEAIITGENSSENMIDVNDGILQVTLRPDNKAPIFAAVYQDYVARYGLEMSIGSPADFFIESASMFTEGMQIGRFQLRPRPSILSLQNPEHKEMIDFLGHVVGYYKQETAKEFLVYGQLMRPLEFREPSPMPMLKYALGGEFPALMSGVFRSGDGELGIFVVNAGTRPLEFQAELDMARYGMPANTIVDVESVAPDGASRNLLRKAKGIIPLKGSLPAHNVTMFRLKPMMRD